MQNQTADVTWKDNGVPVSVHFDDPYFSLEGGMEETRHVFLQGNDLPSRFCDGFHIAELGFGTGLSFLTTLQAWRETGQDGRLMFTSFEAFPMTRDDLALALKQFEDLSPLASDLLDVWPPEVGTVQLGGDVALEVVLGDVRRTLPQWGGAADAWFLDGFSPAKNPEMWSPEVMQQVAKHTAPGGSLATYTAAGFVRRSLAEVGFAVERTPGFGRKRHMTRGVFRA